MVVAQLLGTSQGSSVVPPVYRDGDLIRPNRDMPSFSLADSVAVVVAVHNFLKGKRKLLFTPAEAGLAVSKTTAKILLQNHIVLTLSALGFLDDAAADHVEGAPWARLGRAMLDLIPWLQSLASARRGGVFCRRRAQLFRFSFGRPCLSACSHRRRGRLGAPTLCGPRLPPSPDHG